MEDLKNMARTFALGRHGEQTYGGHPYSYHLDGVAEITKAFGEEEVAAACLQKFLILFD